MVHFTCTMVILQHSLDYFWVLQVNCMVYEYGNHSVSWYIYGITFCHHHISKYHLNTFFVRLTLTITCLVGIYHSAQAKTDREKSLAQCRWLRAELHIDICVWERSASVRRRCQWESHVNYTSSCIIQHS